MIKLSLEYHGMNHYEAGSYEERSNTVQHSGLEYQPDTPLPSVRSLPHQSMTHVSVSGKEQLPAIDVFIESCDSNEGVSRLVEAESFYDQLDYCDTSTPADVRGTTGRNAQSAKDEVTQGLSSSGVPLNSQGICPAIGTYPHHC